MLTTTNYDDFRKIVADLFGGGFKTFFGNRRTPHSSHAIVYVTDNQITVRYDAANGLPESFAQEFGRAVPLAAIDDLKWE